MTNLTNRVLYVGMTSNLIKRVYQHREKLVKGFTAKYHVDKLFYYEVLEDINEVIKREKLLKAGSREKKLKLIEKTNSGFDDLYRNIIQ